MIAMVAEAIGRNTICVNVKPSESTILLMRSTVAGLMVAAKQSVMPS